MTLAQKSCPTKAHHSNEKFPDFVNPLSMTDKPSILDKLAPRDRGILSKQKELHDQEQKAADMSSEQT
jgi:hypothetical protein